MSGPPHDGVEGWFLGLGGRDRAGGRAGHRDGLNDLQGAFSEQWRRARPQPRGRAHRRSRAITQRATGPLGLRWWRGVLLMPSPMRDGRPRAAADGGLDLEGGSFSGARQRGGVDYLQIAAIYRAGKARALPRARNPTVSGPFSVIARPRPREASGLSGVSVLGRPVAQKGGSRKFSRPEEGLPKGLAVPLDPVPVGAPSSARPPLPTSCGRTRPPRPAPRCPTRSPPSGER